MSSPVKLGESNGIPTPSNSLGNSDSFSYFPYHKMNVKLLEELQKEREILLVKLANTTSSRALKVRRELIQIGILESTIEDEDPAIILLQLNNSHYSPPDSECSTPPSPSPPSQTASSPSPSRTLSQSSSSLISSPFSRSLRSPSFSGSISTTFTSSSLTNSTTVDFLANKKKRQRTSPEQLEILEHIFETQKMPNQQMRQELADQLGMSTRRIQIWFQNKRAKVKRNPNSSTSPLKADPEDEDEEMDGEEKEDSSSSS